jgi:hypothetical protein
MSPRYGQPAKPLFLTGAPLPNCVQEGCTHDALFFAVYGCINSHTYEGYYCQPCMMSKKDRIKTNRKYTHGTYISANYPKNESVWACQYTHPLVDFAFVALHDPFRHIHDWEGERIFF